MKPLQSLQREPLFAAREKCNYFFAGMAKLTGGLML
jgi:hypothetical protein